MKLFYQRQKPAIYIHKLNKGILLLNNCLGTSVADYCNNIIKKAEDIPYELNS
jgi:hypothetical protein